MDSEFCGKFRMDSEFCGKFRMDSEFLGINKMGFVNQPFSSTTPVEVTGPRDVFRDIWTFMS